MYPLKQDRRNIIVDNGVEPREVIAEGDINEINICCVEKFEKIKNHEK